MNPLWWILIVLAILLLVVLIVIALSKASKQAKLIDEILNNAKVVNYCFIKQEGLLKLFSEEELKMNKFVTRPFICITSDYLKQHNLYLVVPQRTNKKEKIYVNDVYLSNGAYKLVPQNYFFIKESEADLKSHYAKQEINKQRLDEIKTKTTEIVNLVSHFLKQQPDVLKALPK